MKKSFLALTFFAALAGGCAVTQPQNTPVPERLEFNPVVNRGYWLYVPSTYSHRVPSPLIVSCHGTPPYDVANHHIRELKMLGERNNCIVIAPELVATDGIIGDGPIVGMLANEKIILSAVSRIAYRYNIDRNNVMITGFSGGGFPTYWVGLRHPDVFTCIVGRSADFNRGNLDGWYPEGYRDVAIKVYYGSNDPGAIQAQSKSASEYLRSKGFKVETQVLRGVGHERHPEVAMEFFMRTRRPPRGSLD